MPLLLTKGRTMTTTTDVPGTAGTLQLRPYIFFYGRCEEAMEFYKKVLGGTYDVTRNSDTPMANDLPAQWKGKVMHASFTAPGVSFLGSDGREAKTVDPDAGNISLALSAADRDTGERIFAALSDGGNVTMPLNDAFWGGRFGDVIDRFGIEWMVTTP